MPPRMLLHRSFKSFLRYITLCKVKAKGRANATSRASKRRWLDQDSDELIDSDDDVFGFMSSSFFWRRQSFER